MPTPGSGLNQIVPFATGVGANVESPVDWAADIVRQQGFQAGTASSQKANTVLRQASFISAVLAQFMADYSGIATNDDGDVINAEENLITALEKLFAPFGVYFIIDTGTGDHVVGTSDPAPTSYSSPSFVVFKKSNTANTGPMDINLWTLGAVPLKDNTGADLSNGAILANSFYITVFDGGGFRILGGATSYTSVTNLTANSGDMVAVAVDGTVDWRTLLGTHSTTHVNTDRFVRGRGSDDAALYETETEFITWLNGVLDFLKVVPPSGPGTQVGQFVNQLVTVWGYNDPTYAGFALNMVATSAQLQFSAWPGVDIAKLHSWIGVNGAGGGNLSAMVGHPSSINGVLAGNWKLVGWSLVSWALGIYTTAAYSLTWVRIS